MNVVAFFFMVIVNVLAGSTAIIGGKNTAQISDENPTLITPAGYVFAIWGGNLPIAWDLRFCSGFFQSIGKRF
ncbi:MAG: hypothetical protein N3D12_05720 [Candidatus Methanomethyliaceae archaeon]|nr:hypothetical protein [Candidatus Methanomethyliaceae archaeon]